MKRISRSILIALLIQLPLGAATFTVLNTNDSGTGSLRWAIDQVNAQPSNSTNQIRFNIPGPGPHVIALTTQLPPVYRNNTSIVGESQPGYATQPLVALNGAGFTVSFGYRGVGLSINGQNCEVGGLAFGGFRRPETVRRIDNDGDAGIRLEGHNAVIRNCYFGCDTTGTSATQGALDAANSEAVLLLADGARIEHCVFAYNYTGIMGRYRALSFAGTNVLPSQLSVTESQFGILPNGIRAIFGPSIYMAGISLPGTNFSIRNNDFGVEVGIDGRSSSGLVAGNYFGISRLTTALFPHRISTLGEFIQIGEAGVSTSTNYFCGASEVCINTHGGTIRGNVFGRTPLGQIAPNAGPAMVLTGVLGEVSNNTISYCGTGILVRTWSPTSTPMSGNTFDHIGGMAVDNQAAPSVYRPYVGDGPTPWDVLDVDSGPNGLQNQPLLDTVSYDSLTGLTRVSGRLFSRANSSYAIELYSSPASAGLPVEAHVFHLRGEVVTGPGGEATFSFDVPGLFNARYFTAQATQIGSYIAGTGGSSEFSDPVYPPTGTFRLSGGGAITEGSGLTRTLTVTRNGGSYGPASVSLLINTSAPNGGPADYTLSEGPVLNFANGEESKTITVNAVDDALDEDPELYVVTLANLDFGRSASGQAVFTILDDDDPPLLSVGDVTVTEGQQVILDVGLNNASGKTVTVNYRWYAGSALASDFGNFNTGVMEGSFELPPSFYLQQLTADTFDDLIPEGTEFFYFEITGATNASLGQSTARISILDNDSPPVATTGFQWDALPFSTTEAGGGFGAVFVRIQRTGSLAGEARVRVTTLPGTAGLSDFTPVTSQEFVFAHNEEFKTVPIPINDDTVFEDSEYFSLYLHGATAASGPAWVPESSLFITILDNDLPPAASLTIGSVVEGDEGVTLIPITVTLAEPAEAQVAVTIDIAGGSADHEDYLISPFTVIFSPGSVRCDCPGFLVIGDRAHEPDETVKISAKGILPGQIGDNVEMTIFNDDPSKATFSIEGLPTEIPEDQESTYFTLRRSGVLTEESECSVKIGLGDRTASIEGEGFTFAPGEETIVVRLNVRDDILDEPDEQISLLLVPKAPAEAPVVTHFLVVTDNEEPPAIVLGGVTTITERDADSVVQAIEIRLSAPSGYPVDVTIKSNDDTALAGSDYLTVNETLNFAPGELSKTISVTVLPDRTDELDEKFTLYVSSAIHATLPSESATITIIDNDTPLRPYRDWLGTHFTPSERGSAVTIDPCADPDRDGLSNGLEFFLNSNPRSETSGNDRFSLSRQAGSGDYLWQFSGKFSRAEFAEISPEFSINLVSWGVIPSGSMVITDSLPDTRTYRISLPLATYPTVFFRTGSGCREVEAE